MDILQFSLHLEISSFKQSTIHVRVLPSVVNLLVIEGPCLDQVSASPDFVFRKGELESIHVINEDSDTHSKHNFNIDQFKVHTKDLSYFESQTITFIADKNGTFSYFCTCSSGDARIGNC